MFRLFALVMAGVFASLGSARADFLTGEATANVQTVLPSTPGGPPVPLVTQFGMQNGGLFTNTTSFGGGPGAIGNTVNTVGAAPVVTARVSGSTESIASASGNRIVAVFGVSGSVVADNGVSQTARFTTGKIAFYADTGSFNAFDPTTWGFGGTPLATYDLAVPQNIATGPGGTPFAPGAFNPLNVNTSGANATSFAQTQGQFLFLENPSSNFIDVTSLSNLFGEGIFARIDQTIQQYTLPSGNADDNLTPQELQVLNDIATFAGLPLTGGVNGLGFATGFGGAAATDYSPQNNPATNGDFRGELGGRFDPGAFDGFTPPPPVPEPVSLAVFAGVMGVGGLVYRRRTAKTVA